MHELSLIYSILEAAEHELRQQQTDCRVEAIELEIGELAGVEISSMEFLWPAAVEQTALEKAACHITRVPGAAVCNGCGQHFPVQQFYDPCPHCGSHLIRITKGEELRIKSLTLLTEEPAREQLLQNWN